jgi:hypothetical protein
MDDKTLWKKEGRKMQKRDQRVWMQPDELLFFIKEDILLKALDVFVWMNDFYMCCMFFGCWWRPKVCILNTGSLWTETVVQ